MAAILELANIISNKKATLWMAVGTYENNQIIYSTHLFRRRAYSVAKKFNGRVVPVRVKI